MSHYAVCKKIYAKNADEVNVKGINRKMQAILRLLGYRQVIKFSLGFLRLHLSEGHHFLNHLNCEWN